MHKLWTLIKDREEGSSWQALSCPLCSISKVITLCWSALLFSRLSGYMGAPTYRGANTKSCNTPCYLNSITWTVWWNVSLQCHSWLGKSSSISPCKCKSLNWAQVQKRSNLVHVTIHQHCSISLRWMIYSTWCDSGSGIAFFCFCVKWGLCWKLRSFF